MNPVVAKRDDETRLLGHYRELDASDRSALLAFAAFLVARRADQQLARPPAEPRHEPRPDQETVVAAIKRLSASYYMLDPGVLFGETSALVSAHVLQGRTADDVIVELEQVFERHYAAYRQSHAPTGA
ncbi:hypothetical protein ABC977_11290 [Thioalkalicoccus limnaeus]|uniref:Crp/Fnr family transcriptional regulator n=1 Tax=Thioalkalicoccus limnaeus TaxID=120681 RepID=A0ABV4BEN7_9GAMM